MRRKALVGLFLAVLLAAQLVIATTASSAPQTCTTSGHCYAQARVGPTTGGAGFHGAYGYLHAACLQNSDTTDYFSTIETWLEFTNGLYWIEAGIARGSPQGGHEYFYWADERPGGGYHEHDDLGSAVNNGTNYQFTIAYLGSSQFGVGINQTGGTSTAWGTHTASDNIVTGTETSGGKASIYGSSSQLGYYTLSDAPRDGWTWGGGGTQPENIPANWGFVQTVTTDSWYRYGTVTSAC